MTGLRDTEIQSHSVRGSILWEVCLQVLISRKTAEFPEKNMMEGRKEELHESGGLDWLLTVRRSHSKGLSHRHGEVIGNFKQREDDTLILFFKCDPRCSVGNKF